MKRSSVFATSCLLLSLLLLMGCGSKKGAKVAVSGEVTIDGKKISKAGYTLRFSGEGTEGGNAAIAVNDDGTFKGDAIQGKGTVTLDFLDISGHGDENTPGKKEKEINYDDKENFAPLEVDISAGDTLTLDFKKQ